MIWSRGEPADYDAVMDPCLRVNGVQGLRVADCSVIPGHITGNTNAPAMAHGNGATTVILLGENAAEHNSVHTCQTLPVVP